LFSSATKLLLALTVLAIAGAVAAQGAVDDRAAAVIFGFVAFAALAAAITVLASGVYDVAPYVPLDAPPPEPRAVTPGAPARGSGWPLAAAGAVGIVAVGAATNPVTGYVGLIAVILTGLGWFAHSWTDHHTWTRRVSARIADRLVAPILMPLGGFLLAATIAISVSRILLAVNKNVATLVALGIAVVVVLAFFWVASRPRMASSVLVMLAGLAGMSVVGAGIAGATQGERAFEQHEPPPIVLDVVARNVQFNTKSLSAPANKPITIKFVNDDKGIFHNVALYKGDGPTAPPVFNGEGFPGVKTVRYSLTTPGPGTYRFQCDFHANMTGTFTVGG
jgi:plastocyanin